MAWDADDQHTAQERRVGPVDCNHCISLGDGYRISSADNHGARPTDAGGPAIAPLSVEDATLESTTDGTVCIPCPAPPIGSRVLGVRTADNQPPGIKDDGQHGPYAQDIQSNTATDITAPGGTTAEERSPGDARGGLEGS